MLNTLLNLNKTKFFTLIVLSGLLIFFTIANNWNENYLSENIDSYTNDFLSETNEFRLNPEWSICDMRPQTETYLFIAFVIIAPHQFEQRNHIRNTWANKQFSSDVKVLFTVALSKNETINDLLLKEFNTHRDILQIGNLFDSYYNCTVKIMKTYKWIAHYCSNTRYMLKICDDVIVNTPQLINDFKSSIPYKLNHIYGYGIYGVGPIRDPGNKWYVSVKEFNESGYDPYIQGIENILYCLYIG